MNSDYDVVVVGGGIGGLVSATYLAKAGYKVMLAERNANVGGFCNSFEVKGFRFDGCVHSVGDLRPGGQFYEILADLDALAGLDVIQHDPTDTVVTSDASVTFFKDVNKTIITFQQAFPQQSQNIERFFHDVIQQERLDSVREFHHKSFRDILDSHFDDARIKDILAVPVIGNMGVPTTRISAFTGIKLYTQFMIDGGYYPCQGIQALPDAIAKAFQCFGGRLEVSNPVTQIEVKNGRAEALILKSEERVTSRFVVANCDVVHLCHELIGREHIPQETQTRINEMTPSMALFVLYLGLKDMQPVNILDRTNTWFIDRYGYEDHLLNDFIDFDLDRSLDWLLLSPNDDQKTLMTFVATPYKSESFWQEQRRPFMTALLNRLEEKFSGLQDVIVFKTCTTPVGLYKWTNSFQGACYGWASTTDQLMDPVFTRNRILDNMYLSSHWSTLASGVSGVAIVGKRVGKLMAKKLAKAS